MRFLSTGNSASLTTSVFFYLFVLKNKNSGGSIFCLKSGNVTVVSHNLSYAAALNTSIGSAEISTTGARCLETGQYMYQKGTGFDSSLGNGQSNENWGDSGMADNSLQTDTSTDVNTDDKNQLRGVPHGADMVVNSMDQSKGRTSDQKTLRRLAQNREAARRGRLRKKVMSLLGFGFWKGICPAARE
nr:transcription factor PERIANTHIA-like [Populus alba]